MQDQTLEILKKLISFKSVTPHSLGSIEYIATLLKEAGFHCDVQVFGQTEEEKTTNLYARYGNKSPNICFAGHVDVVPPMNEDLWNNDPFNMTIEGENVFGRGAVDMKGAIACALSASFDFLKHHKSPNGSISFLLTSDEEGKAKYGTAKMLEHLASESEKIDFAILGEPTSEKQIGDLIKIGRRGSISFDLTVFGKQGHVAYPERALNPVTGLIKIANDLVGVDFEGMLQCEEPQTTGRHCEEPQATWQSQEAGSNSVVPPEIASPITGARNDDSSNKHHCFTKTNLEITSIDVGNNVTNIIPEKASMKFNVRFNDLYDSKEIWSIVTEIIAKYELVFDLKCHVSGESFMQEYSKNMQLFRDLASKECGLTPKIDSSGGTSDARFIHKYSEVVEFGLACDQAHKINEHTKIRDLQTLCNVYYKALVEFVGIN